MVICVTNRTLCKDNFLKRVESICQAGPKFIILREKRFRQKRVHTIGRAVSCHMQNIRNTIGTSHAHTVCP